MANLTPPDPQGQVCILPGQDLSLASERDHINRRPGLRKTGPGRRRSDCGLGCKGADPPARVLTLAFGSPLGDQEEIGKGRGGEVRDALD